MWLAPRVARAAAAAFLLASMPQSLRRTCFNASVVAVITAYAYRRAQLVGPLAAFAEVCGLGGLYDLYISTYHPLHRSLFGFQRREQWLDTSLLSALAHENATRAVKLVELLHDHGHGVYSLPFLRPEAARHLADEVSHFVESGHPSAMPNSMNEYGVVLSPEGLDGLDGMLDVIRDAFMSLNGVLYSPTDGLPTSADARTAAMAAQAGSCCAAHHAFVVRYNASEQRGIDMHHDASDVTLNVCLEQDLATDGAAADVPGATADRSPSPDEHEVPAELRFCGFVGDTSHRQRSVTYRHAIGRAVIHLGAHRHGATDIMAGTRQNLIVWGFTRRPSEGAPAYHAARLHPAEGPPDLECLSWTHDVDFEQYRQLPPAALAARERKRVSDQLFDLARRATDAHIEKLPASYQPLVRTLRQMQLNQHQDVEVAEGALRPAFQHVD